MTKKNNKAKLQFDENGKIFFPEKGLELHKTDEIYPFQVVDSTTGERVTSYKTTRYAVKFIEKQPLLEVETPDAPEEIDSSETSEEVETPETSGETEEEFVVFAIDGEGSFDAYLKQRENGLKEKQESEAKAKKSSTGRRRTNSKAGVSAFEAFLCFLFSASFTIEQMVDRWNELSGQAKKKTTFATYLSDIRKGKYVPKQYRGVTVNVTKDSDGRYTAEAPEKYQETLDSLGYETICRVIGFNPDAPEESFDSDNVDN